MNSWLSSSKVLRKEYDYSNYYYQRKSNKGFNNKEYKLNSKLLSNNSLINIIKLFFKELESDRKYFVLLRLQHYNSFKIVTLHKGLILSKSDLVNYQEYCKNLLSIKSNGYSDAIFSNILFDYFLIKKDQESKYTNKWPELNNTKNIQLQEFSNSTTTYFLPLNNNYSTWGNVLFSNDSIKIIHYHNNNIIKIHTLDDKTFNGKIYNGKFMIFEFIDQVINDNKFIRSVNNSSYHILNNKIELTTRTNKTKFLKTLKAKAKKPVNIITVKIETINRNGELQPFLYSLFDDREIRSFFEKTPDKLFTYLLRRKYRGYTVYAHYLRKFDIAFLFKYIAELQNSDKYTVEPVLKDGNITSMNIRNNKGVTITYHDSYLYLTQSLQKLSRIFTCKQAKVYNRYYYTPLN